MKQEKRFCHTGANQKTTWFRNFRPLLLRCQNGSIYYQASVGSATVPAGTSKTLQLELPH